MWKPLKGNAFYEINIEGEVRRASSKRHLKLIASGNGRGIGNYWLKGNGKTRVVSKPTLLNENYPYYFIKDLDDDEGCKPFKSADGYYITNKGRVFSTYSGRWLTPYYENRDDIDYYYSVGIQNKRYRLHTEVGKHFLVGYNHTLDVAHIDENLPAPEIYSVSNLRLLSRGDNIKESITKGRSVYATY